MRARLYLDEDVYRGVAVGLRRRGFDVLTTAEADKSGSSDEEQLDFAVANGRCLFTFNRGDFVQLHAARVGAGNHHHGIILSAQDRIGPIVRALARLLSNRTDEGLRDRLIWLSLSDSRDE